MFRARFEPVRLGPDLTVSAAARREMDLVSLLGTWGRSPSQLRSPGLANSSWYVHAHAWAGDMCTSGSGEAPSAVTHYCRAQNLSDVRGFSVCLEPESCDLVHQCSGLDLKL